MTDKKEKIITVALELFANEGYNATSTSKIARKAGVSEGLIFRHFENKKGLLEAIVKDAELKLGQVLAPIIFETDPKEVIRYTIEVPFKLDKLEYDFWKLQYKLKWQEEYNNPHKMKPLLDKLIWAFTELGYQQAEEEAQLLSYILDSITMVILREKIEVSDKFKIFLLEKYNL